MEERKSKLKVAKWYQRLIGSIIDYSICMSIAAIYVDANRLQFFDYGYYDSYEEKKIIQGLTVVCYFFYTLLLESVFSKTLGKLITCTVVKDNRSGARIYFLKSLGRSACRMIPFDAFSFLRKEPIGWHDSFSGTRVVNSVYSYSAFFERFKFLNKGFIRLNIAVSVIIGIPTFGLGFIGYWILFRVILWILDGFKEEELKKVVNS